MIWGRDRDEGLINSRPDLTAAIAVGASHRIRPMVMTGLALIMGLVPIMYSSGSRADLMKRIAAPMLGGVGSALILALVVFPTTFSFWRGRGLPTLKPAPAGGLSGERTGRAQWTRALSTSMSGVSARAVRS